MSKTSHDDGPSSAPREPDVEARIKDATIEVVAEEGFAGLKVESICARAGVAEATFYRRWADGWAVMLDALDDRARLPVLPDRGSLLSDLVAYAQAYLDVCSEPKFVAFMFYLLAQTKSDPSLLAKLDPGFVERRTRNRVLIERAVTRGDLPPGVDGDAILDAILSQCIAWMGTGTTPSPEEISGVIEQLIAPGPIH